MGEIGGTLGMFLGWSLFSIIDISIVKTCGSKNRNPTFFIKLSSIFLIPVLVYWSFDALDKFMTEEETMELQLETDFTRPFVTICREQNYMEMLHERHPCSKNGSTYFKAIRSCTLQSIDITSDLMHNLTYLSDRPYARVAGKDLPLSIFTGVFHETFGFCYNLDPKYWLK